jgi:hypothetical protein
MMLCRITNPSARRATGIGVVLLLAAATGAAQTISGQVQTSEGGRCCLTNFRYSGICEVSVGSGESCGGALSYLNNFQSAGRQYCGNTIIRGGWTLSRCDAPGSGAHVPSSTIDPTEISTISGTVAMEPVRTVSPGTMGRSDATFITPIEASVAGPAAAPGLIDL